MKIVISWSGERSKAIAEIFRLWLPCCLQYIEPWMSDSDIPKGKRWALELAGQLAGANFGLVCLTPENLYSPWVNFEAGALSKLGYLSDSLVNL